MIYRESFITNADKKRAFKAVAPDAKLSSDASKFVELIVNKCVLHMLDVVNINKYINNKKYGKLSRYIMGEVNAALKKQELKYVTQQINFTQFSKKILSKYPTSINRETMITIAVVAEYLMCDLFDKGNNAKSTLKNTVTVGMILDGIKHDKDIANFCQEFIIL